MGSPRRGHPCRPGAQSPGRGGSAQLGGLCYTALADWHSASQWLPVTVELASFLLLLWRDHADSYSHLGSVTCLNITSVSRAVAGYDGPEHKGYRRMVQEGAF